MLKRCLTGAIIVIVVVGFFLLRTVDARLFNILILFLAAVGAFEIARALKGKTLNINSSKSEADKLSDSAEVKTAKTDIFVATILGISALAFVPIYTFFGLIFALSVFVSAIIVLLIYKLCLKKSTWKSFFWTVFALLYPNLLLLTMLVANGLAANSQIALILMFVISPLADTFAFLVGSLIGGKKLCPKISPKKTISGAIGGLVGGTIGAIALFFIFKPTVNFFSPLLLFILIGLIGSVFTEAGDLFESFIKRKVGIKDMGKILPGHGGILDRIDGILFASVFITIIFLLV